MERAKNKEQHAMPLASIPPDPVPTKRQYRKFLRSEFPEPLRSQWAAFEWHLRLQERQPDRFVVAFADQVPNYHEYLDGPLWKKSIRPRVLAEARYECACCEAKATQVHHRDYRPRVLSGDDLSPLVALCKRCHDLIDKVKGKQSWNEAERLLAAMVAAKESQKSQAETLRPRPVARDLR
jgi:hypothetical protein